MKKIKSIEIKDSTFFEDMIIKFDDKMNCIMGGRGTGKSTILYFLKSSLTLDLRKGKMNDILRNNLGNGIITIEIESENGAMYRITKTLNEEPQPVRYPSSEFVSLSRIFDEIECDFYETNVIEEIGRTPLQRLELIDKKVSIEIKELKKDIVSTQLELNSNAQDIKTKDNQISQLSKSIIQYESIENELYEFTKNEPLDLKPGEKSEFENADLNEKKRTDEKRLFSKTIILYSELENRIHLITSDLEENYKSATNDYESFLNKDIIGEVFKYTEDKNSSIKMKLKDILNELSDTRNLISDRYKSIAVLHEAQQAEFVKLKQKFDTNREHFNRLNVLTTRKKEKELLLKDVVDIKIKKDRLSEERSLLLSKLNKSKHSIYLLRLTAIKEINKILQNDVKVTLKFSGIVTEFEDRLRDALKGSGLRYNELVSRIVENFKPDQFAKVVQLRDYSALTNISNIDEVRSLAIIESLADSEAIYQIETIYCEDLPDFKLRIEGDDVLMDNYKNSDELSMGQRCTTVLPIIFAVSNNPLIIDQPEDNLDNKYISSKIHQIIGAQKNERQLIFITHNPNIPVLAGSEYNLFLNYENRKSKKLVEGSISKVKDEIITILEGGRNAFNYRKEIYGDE